MDVRHEKLLISISLRTAEEQKSESLRDFFTSQAARQQARLDEFLAKSSRIVKRRRSRKK